MKYQSEILKEIIDKEGHITSLLHYESECIETWIEEVKGSYPKLCDYEGEWLNYINENPIGEFPYITLDNVTNATVNNVVPYAFKSAILKGCTGYRDNDTAEILETFEEGRNLELVSVKMPVLTTSNEDGTKTNILTVNDDVTLRGIGDVKDELNMLTGEMIQQVDKMVMNGSEKWMLTSDENNTTIRFALSLPNSIPTTLLCDTFKVESTYGKEYECIQLTDNKTLVLRISKNKATNLNELKTYLQQNPITIIYKLAEKSIKTVDLTITNQDGEIINRLRPIEGTMYLSTDGQDIKPTFTGEIPVEAITQNLTSFIKEQYYE